LPVVFHPVDAHMRHRMQGLLEQLAPSSQLQPDSQRLHC
jgi:hypothetical protein